MDLSENQKSGTNNGGIRQRMIEAMQRFGYKQIDVAKETSSIIRHTPLDSFTMASR